MAIPYVIFTDLETETKYNSYYTYSGLILSKVEIGVPSVKTTTIDIPGSHGILDLSETFGQVFYGSRTLSFTFSTVQTPYAWEELKRQIATDLHGKRFKINIWSDPNYNYIGRCSIDKYQSSKGLGTITIQCVCDPFKEQIQADSSSFIISAGSTFGYNVSTYDKYTKLSISGTAPFRIYINETLSGAIGSPYLFEKTLLKQDDAYVVKIYSETQQTITITTQSQTI